MFAQEQSIENVNKSAQYLSHCVYRFLFIYSFRLACNMIFGWLNDALKETTISFHLSFSIRQQIFTKKIKTKNSIESSCNTCRFFEMITNNAFCVKRLQSSKLLMINCVNGNRLVELTRFLCLKNKSNFKTLVVN